MIARLEGSRILIALCGVLVVLLAASVALQYRWSRRVAAADAQREREHLQSGASLFATEFNSMVGQVAAFLKSQAWTAFQSGRRLAKPPRSISELYFANIGAQGNMEVRQLAADGSFVQAVRPAWMARPVCVLSVTEQPLTLVVPIYDFSATDMRRGDGIRYMQAFGGQLSRCFVARLDEKALRTEILPQMIRQSFGATVAREYAFAVLWRGQPDKAVYGEPMRADLRRPFFALQPEPILFPSKGAVAGQPSVRVEHFESTIISHGSGNSQNVMNLFDGGIWELEVAHKGEPLAAAFEREANWNVLLSLGVEMLLLGAIAFLLIGARQMQQLADQKMSFVAGISHELRTPVSAISMLARNQADGLVTEPAKVKQYGELINQQSNRLNEMVEQVLAYAGVQSGAPQRARREIDVRLVIENCVQARRTDLEREGIVLEVAVSSELPKMWSDEGLLQIAIDNLLSNAQKHGREGRWIRISANFDAGKKEICIAVEDCGPGVGAAEQAEIFEPFYRGRAAMEAQIPGSGLGLSLVRGAAQAHNGRVSVTARPGGGSTFTMHLPV